MGKVCRYSDAARVLYEPGIDSQARIAKTTGENTGSLDVAGHFSIASQDNSSTHFSGTMHKVGRTTGWSSGTVSNTCATVNVSGSNIQLRCQTLVEGNGQIVAGGDSGSPVFTRTSGDNVMLRGILWGGNSSGNLFVFSPFSAVQNELGALDATTDGTSEDPVEEGPGRIAGTVTSSDTGDPIQNATVTVNGTTYTANTGSDGQYSITDVPTGTYNVTASKSGYDPVTETDVQVSEDGTTTVNFALAEASTDPEVGNEPVVESFESSTRTTGPWLRITVQWSVSHPDNALEGVTSELFNGLDRVDAVSSSVSGGSASGEHELRTRGSVTEVCLTVSDTAGNEVKECNPLS